MFKNLAWSILQVKINKKLFTSLFIIIRFEVSAIKELFVPDFE